MTKIAASVGVIATILTSTVAASAPGVAAAQTYDRYGHRVYSGHGYARGRDYDRYCRHAKRSAGNKGTVAGALVGGASGALIGGDVLGGLVGAGVGAVAGHAIAKGRTHC